VKIEEVKKEESEISDSPQKIRYVDEEHGSSSIDER